MSRAAARAEAAQLARFKCKAGAAGLITALVPAGQPLDVRDQYGTIFNSVLQDWRCSPSSHCFCCRQDGKPPGAMLFSALCGAAVVGIAEPLLLRVREASAC